MGWNLARQICRTKDCHDIRYHDLIRLGQFAVATSFGSEVDNHRTRGHAANSIGRDDPWRRLAWDRGRCDADVAAGDRAGHEFALLLVELFAELLGVAAGAFGAGGFERDFDKRGTYTLYLFLHGGANVVR